MFTAIGRPVKACTRSGAASLSARKMEGERYQPLRVRMFTAAGRFAFRIEPSGAFTRNGR